MMEKLAEKLNVPANELATFFRENLEEILAEKTEVLSTSCEEIFAEGNFRSVQLNMEVKNGQKESGNITCNFDVHHYQGYIRKLAKPSENGGTFPLANISLLKIVIPKDSRPPRLKEVAKVDVRTG